MTAEIAWIVTRVSFCFVLWVVAAMVLKIPGHWVAPLMMTNTLVVVLALSAKSTSFSTLPGWPTLLLYFVICAGNGWACIAYGNLMGNTKVPRHDVIVLQCVMSIIFTVILTSLYYKTPPSPQKIGAYLLCILAIIAVVKTR